MGYFDQRKAHEAWEEPSAERDADPRAALWLLLNVDIKMSDWHKPSHQRISFPHRFLLKGTKEAQGKWDVI